MDTDPRRTTAQIFRFPVGGRAARERDARRASRPENAVPSASFGGGWYHDAAIKDARDENAPPRH